MPSKRPFGVLGTRSVKLVFVMAVSCSLGVKYDRSLQKWVPGKDDGVTASLGLEMTIGQGYCTAPDGQLTRKVVQFKSDNCKSVIL
jgi:hypothetical protein